MGTTKPIESVVVRRTVITIIFLLTGLHIYTGKYKAQGLTGEYKARGPRYARPKGGHYEGRGLCIRLYRYANQLVRSLLPD